MTNAPESERWEELISRTESVLSRTFGGEVTLGNPERLTDEGRRNLLLRFQVLSAPEGAPASVAIKRAREDDYRPDDPDCFPAQGLFRDWAGLQFLAEAGGSATGCPRFYGGDRESGFIVMEDLGAGEDLAHRLLEGAPVDAEEGLILLAETLGRMHAETAGREEDYLRIRGSLSAWKDSDRYRNANEIRDCRKKIEEICDSLSAPTGSGFAADVETVASAIEEPGPLLAYTHGDPCPDNTLLTGNRLRLFDYEFGGFRHALLDGVYGRIRFPTCWCVGEIPKAAIERMEAAYRKEWASVHPALADDAVYGKAIAKACAFWLLENLSGMLPGALEKDGEWGIATIRQRLMKRLTAFIEISEKTRRLTSLRDVSLSLRETLETRWKPDLADLPLYRAFASPAKEETPATAS